MSEWVTLRVELPGSLEEPVASFLFDVGANGIVTEAVAPGWLRLEAPVPAGEESATRARLMHYLVSLADIEPAAAGLVVTSEPVPLVDWVALARLHHRPVAVGRRLLVAPPWDVPAADGRELIVIEPGMAFGTGQHATTRGCLEAIEDIVTPHACATALDVGTGSALLAIALARLGVPRVVAIDIDRAVLPLARTNLDQNRAAHVLLAGGTAASLRTAFDMVVANLLADTVIADAQHLTARVAPDGHLILSGLRTDQVPAVREAYPAWSLTTHHTEDGWATLTMQRSGSRAAAARPGEAGPGAERPDEASAPAGPKPTAQLAEERSGAPGPASPGRSTE